MPPWKLVVEDLGRIAHAEIEARPLLLFVGRNNTGKTYLASLLWGLLALGAELPLTRAAAFQRSVAWIEERFARREHEPGFDLTPDAHADLVQIVNDTLRDQGTALVELTFNRVGLRVGKIELRDVARRDESSASVGSLPECNDLPCCSRFFEDWKAVADEPQQRDRIIDLLVRNPHPGLPGRHGKRSSGRRFLGSNTTVQCSCPRPGPGSCFCTGVSRSNWSAILFERQVCHGRLHLI